MCVCVCVRTNARARGWRVLRDRGVRGRSVPPSALALPPGPRGARGTKNTGRAPAHHGRGTPVPRRTAQRPAPSARRTRPGATGSPGHCITIHGSPNTADTAHTPTHHVRIGKTYTHALCSAGPAARRQRIIPRPARVSSRYSARSAALFVFGPSLHRHPPGQGGPGGRAFPAVCRAWRHAACAAGAQYLAAMQGRAQRCAALCGQPDNRPRCSLGSGLCALYGRCAASSVPSLYCGPGRLGVSMARAFVRCDCAGRALLADVRGGVVCTCASKQVSK